MTQRVSLEKQLLRTAVELLDESIAHVPSELKNEARFRVLEAVAAKVGGFSLRA